MTFYKRLLATTFTLNFIYHFLLQIIVVCTSSVRVQYPPADNEFFANESGTQEKVDQLNLPKGQTLVVRLPSNTLLKYTSYKDVSILHFKIPTDSRTAYFTFKAFEESTSTFQRKCSPRDVTLHLKASSYPVISSENITFPRNFLSEGQRYKIYNLQFQSNGIHHPITVNGPIIGNWFAIAFLSWSDPHNERIEQQGIASSCETLLLAEMSVAKFSPIILNSGQIHTASLTETCEFDMVKNTTIEQTYNEASSPSALTQNLYKFFVPEPIGTTKAILNFGKVCDECANIDFLVKANSLPGFNEQQNMEDLETYYTVIKPNQTSDISVEFYVQPNMWHYAVLQFTDSETKKILNPSSNINKSTKSKQATHKQKTHKDCQNITVLEYTIKFEYNTPNISKSQHSVFKKTSTSFQNNEFNAHNSSERAWQPVLFRNMDFYPLLRQTHREFFMFDYDLPPDNNGTVPTLLNLTATRAAGFAFEIGEVYDIGGTLSFGVSVKHSIKGSEGMISKPLSIKLSERTSIIAEKLTAIPFAKQDESSQNVKKKMHTNQTIIVCMYHNQPAIPTWPDKCRYGQKLLPASAIVNNTDLNTSTGLVHVPFPESGQWFVTMGLYCHGAETAARATFMENIKEFIRLYGSVIGDMKSTCACAALASTYQKCVNDLKCLAALNETETLKIKECLTDSKCTPQYLEMLEKFELHQRAATEQHFAVDDCTSSVVFSISSSPCVAGRCGRFGHCYHYMSGGFVFSTCVCMKGYRGWDCSEDSQVPSSMSILLASLFLTLSNLLFLPSIYVATKRQYYSEAIIYFFAMFFSIFYHACDSGEDEYSFCLVKISVLQFCDFYCGLLAIWVTLVAMSHIRQQFASILHMFGAILLAFGTELNKQSLWIFLAPALTGICIMSASWGLRCYKTKKVFPGRKYLIIWMPLGTAMVMVGLVCYAFLQTKQNYHIVHSIWHMLMALSLLCLLPSKNILLTKC